jgi:hypothetical protein
MAQELIAVPTKDGVADFLPVPEGAELVRTDAGTFVLLPENSDDGEAE